MRQWGTAIKKNIRDLMAPTLPQNCPVMVVSVVVVVIVVVVVVIVLLLILFLPGT